MLNPEEALIAKERTERFQNLTGLSQEAKQVVKLILDAPSEITEQIKDGRGTHRYSLNKLEKVIRKEFKWSWKVIWQSFREIKDWLDEL